MNFPKKLEQKLIQRATSNTLRSLKSDTNRIDFYSNDYLGLAQSESVFDQTHQLLLDKNIKINGATGSRLISGNHQLYQEAENYIAQFHNSPKALLFNSGYDANVGFFSCVPQRGDVILYDEYIHASIRDGIQLSNTKNYKFKHNDLDHLEKQLVSVRAQSRTKDSEIYIVTESVFSMDGDTPNLNGLITVTKQHNAYLVVDEAHALGVFGEKGEGLVQQLQLENEVFARIITYGKALGCHGATILSNEKLYSYLINFSRSFIYTTGLSPHALATIQVAYLHLNSEIIQQLEDNINFFKSEVRRLQLNHSFIESNSAIHCSVISGIEKTKAIALKLQENGFNIKPILSPTVPEGQERLRFCLHSFNSKKHITTILEQLAHLI
ncbi:aminotransferase class I/II-fold pyridoxal phosphate-dependent enzyme [Tenacibaculum jejuense]|uniref:7-keto-8-aminopelargonate synthetase-like enzyme n=1 Tax=Tenacibaculum jejuense TaxID=584609 RepID=A0A238U4G8_9FLAO|nr:aminotransferase class I/II-fold pyridoxal phosphate-dependent enzyme [Tenacibaculum jejuense]SNR14101.1 7-keto-8-aminopelargonate synthetase-like enzyme [Tenacibaculum jejuense]